MYWSIARRIPTSAWVVSIAYMIAMFLLSEREGTDRLLHIWFWTGIPVFWAWVAAVWLIQRRRGSDAPTDEADPT